ncbi:DUF4405 domain-containing protein [Methanocalculus sp.]|uniref:DUF4405 domain-containing protein n=1 Tax=Methanocalculus sp. TaxID=2004547 RepID=UPI00271742BC|nr:DUF4405 domain-containing protein [Methanocalculus sp.]MDO8842417.1 DUF4405 domain-containing protein [Methanocalculus sp.]
MERRDILYYTDIGMLISFLLCSITGFIKWPGLISKLNLSYQTVHYSTLTWIHDWSGLLLCLLAILHLAMHWRWLVAMTRKKLHQR